MQRKKKRTYSSVFQKASLESCIATIAAREFDIFMTGRKEDKHDPSGVICCSKYRAILNETQQRTQKSLEKSKTPMDLAEVFNVFSRVLLVVLDDASSVLANANYHNAKALVAQHREGGAKLVAHRAAV